MNIYIVVPHELLKFASENSTFIVEVEMTTTTTTTTTKTQGVYIFDWMKLFFAKVMKQNRLPCK